VLPDEHHLYSHYRWAYVAGLACAFAWAIIMFSTKRRPTSGWSRPRQRAAIQRLISIRSVLVVAENQSLPRKQRYTARKIFEQLQSGGYAGSESHVRCYVAQQHQVRPGATATPGGGSPGR
jgi:hypothetical protein